MPRRDLNTERLFDALCLRAVVSRLFGRNEPIARWGVWYSTGTCEISERDRQRGVGNKSAPILMQCVVMLV